MLNVSSWSIRNPIPAVMLFVLLTLTGLLGFQAMKVQQFPDIDLPTITVTASLPGAAPAQMETEVARKIENAVAALQGVKNLYTKVQDGVAMLTVEFRLGLVDVSSTGSARCRPASTRSAAFSARRSSTLPIGTICVSGRLRLVPMAGLCVSTWASVPNSESTATLGRASCAKAPPKPPASVASAASRRPARKTRRRHVCTVPIVMSNLPGPVPDVVAGRL